VESGRQPWWSSTRKHSTWKWSAFSKYLLLTQLYAKQVEWQWLPERVDLETLPESSWSVDVRGDGGDDGTMELGDGRRKISNLWPELRSECDDLQVNGIFILESVSNLGRPHKLHPRRQTRRAVAGVWCDSGLRWYPQAISADKDTCRCFEGSHYLVTRHLQRQDLPSSTIARQELNDFNAWIVRWAWELQQLPGFLERVPGSVYVWYCQFFTSPRQRW